jgi:hypothetical protein
MKKQRHIVDKLKFEIMQKIQEMKEKESKGEALTPDDRQVLFLAALLEESYHGERTK